MNRSFGEQAMRGFTVLVAVLFAVLAVGLAQNQPRAPLEFDGLVTPSGKVNISAAVDGLLETVAFDRGDVVEKGQLVATLKSEVEEAQVKLAKARADMEAELRRSQASLAYSSSKLLEDEKLFEKGILSEQEYEEIKTQKALDEAAVLQARENTRLAAIEHERAVAFLGERRLYSPITGVVVERFLSPGELMTRQTETKILQLAQISPLWVELILAVAELGTVSVGMKAEVRLEQPVGGVHTATVTVVDRVIDPGSGTFGVRLELPNPDQALPAGLKCKVRFVQ